ncbi:MAG: hypothetical protein IT176_10020 [Acidobacteria bacterium]|nr:hypothetical protein [Acidobacteriota bacterium]
MSEIVWAPDVVEESVLLAERRLPPADARAFRRQRDRIYRELEPDRREVRFQTLHLEWFRRLRLAAILEQTIEAHGAVLQRVRGCAVARARSNREAGADLVDASQAGSDTDRRPMLLLQVMPAALLDPAALAGWLQHELMHVSDMLDPAFGYQRTLPSSPDDPVAGNIVRDRYRVLWDVSIDGRLARAGRDIGAKRAVRAFEFAATFRMLGDRLPEVFDDWFDRVQPTHGRILAVAGNPGGRPVDAGRCPVCRLPTGAPFDSAAGLTAPVEALVRANHPGWRAEHGLCLQCRDLYEARHADFARARGLHDAGRLEVAAPHPIPIE